MPGRIGVAKKRLPRRYLKQWRMYRGLTQAKLAERIGTTKATISRIESYHQGTTDSFMVRAADALSTDVASLRLRDPTNEDSAMWELWQKATPLEREAIIALVRTFLQNEVHELAPFVPLTMVSFGVT